MPNVQDEFLDNFLDFRDAIAPVKLHRKLSLFIPPEYCNYNIDLSNWLAALALSPSTQIFQWLKKIGLERYSDTFLANGYFDISTICTLEEIDLEAVGIESQDDR
jgi:hypothetical protein